MEKSLIMKCREINMLEFVNGDLSPGETAGVLAHLDACPGCTRTFEALRDLKVHAPEIRERLGPGFREYERGALFGLFRLRWAAACALLLCAAGAALVWVSVRGPRQSGVEDLLETVAYPYDPGVLRGAPPRPAPPDRDALMSLYAGGDYGKFLRDGGSWAASNPGDASVELFLGIGAYMEKDWADSVKYLQNCRAKAPKNPVVLWYLANALLRKSDVKSALPVLRELSGDDHPYSLRAKEILGRVGSQ